MKKNIYEPFASLIRIWSFNKIITVFIYWIICQMHEWARLKQDWLVTNRFLKNKIYYIQAKDWPQLMNCSVLQELCNQLNMSSKTIMDSETTTLKTNLNIGKTPKLCKENIPTTMLMLKTFQIIRKPKIKIMPHKISFDWCDISFCAHSNLKQ